MVLQEQMYWKVRVYYGIRPTVASWDNLNIYGMRKATPKYHLGHIFKYTEN